MVSSRRALSSSSILASLLGVALAANGCGSGSGTGGAGGSGVTVVTSADTGPGPSGPTGPSGTSSTGIGSYCGDGVVDPGETCDTGGVSATCDADCTAPVCGDGVWNPLAGEECDDGNTMNGDACSDQCKPTVFSLTKDLPSASQLLEQARVIGTGNRFLVVYSQIETNGDRTLSSLAYDVKGTVTVMPSTLASGQISFPVMAADGTGAGRIVWGSADALHSKAFANGGMLGVGEGPIAYPHFDPGSLVALDNGGFCAISLGGDTRCRGNINWNAPSTLVPFAGSAPFASALLAPHTGGLLANYRASDGSHSFMPLDGQAASSGSASVLSASGTSSGPIGYVAHTDGSVVVVGTVASPAVKAVYYPFQSDGTLDAANQHDIAITDLDIAVAGAPDGRFVMAYRTLTQTAPTYTCQVSVQVYSATGAPVGSPKIVGDPPTHVCDRSPRVARSQAGDVMVTWEREDTTTLPSPAKFEAILLPGLLPP